MKRPAVGRAPWLALVPLVGLIGLVILPALGHSSTVDAPESPHAAETGANGYVYTITPLSDGKFLIGGEFTEVLGLTRNRIARLTSTGALDETFNANANSDVRSIVVESGGQITFAGDFTSVGGIAQNRLARVDATGLVDPTFNNGLAGPDGRVHVIVRQGDGKYLIGGTFLNVNGVSRARIARLNSDGSLDTSFNPGGGVTGAFEDAVVHTIAVQADGKVLIGGTFDTVDGTARNHLARLNANGTLDAAFNAGVDSTVYRLQVLPDTTIVVGGFFGSIAGGARRRIARLKVDGTLQASFGGNDLGADQGLYTFRSAGAGYLIGGRFTEYNNPSSTTRNHLARIDANGVLDPGCDPGVGPTADPDVFDVAPLAGGNIVVGGPFKNFGGKAWLYYAVLDATCKALDPPADATRTPSPTMSPSPTRTPSPTVTAPAATASPTATATATPVAARPLYVPVASTQHEG
ncbi:MAG: delta-60 repeat domain-containing protein [Dehalococcoidia bacterium]